MKGNKDAGIIVSKDTKNLMDVGLLTRETMMNKDAGSEDAGYNIIRHMNPKAECRHRSDNLKLRRSLIAGC